MSRIVSPIARIGCGKFTIAYRQRGISTRAPDSPRNPRLCASAAETCCVSDSTSKASASLPGLLRVEGDLLPVGRLGDELAQRPRALARLDGQQPDRRRAGRVVEDLRGAARRASLAGGQEPAAEVGEEERVDELALAARDLRHEGDRQAVRREPPLEVCQPGGGVVVGQPVREGPAAQLRQGCRQVVSPALQRGEAGLEGAMFHGAGQGAHRWHDGQWKVARPECRETRTAAPHAGQGSPARPYTAYSRWKWPGLPSLPTKSRSVLPPAASARESVARTSPARRSIRSRDRRPAAQDGPDARGEERLVGVDVADARDDVGVHEELLHGDAPPARGAVQVFAAEGLVEGLHPEARQQGVLVGIAHPQHRAESPGIVEADDVAAVEDQVHVVVPACGPIPGHDRERSRHAEVHEQVPRRKVEEEVLAAPPDAVHARAAKAAGQVARHRPAKAWLPHHDVAHAPPHDAGDKTQAGRFDFREFRHEGRGGVCGRL